MTRKIAAKEQPSLLDEGAVAAPKPKNAVARVTKTDDRPGSLLMLVDRVLQNPAIPTEKVIAIVDKQLELEREASRRAFTMAKLELRKKLPVINKDGMIVVPAKNGKTGHNTRYATFENIMNVIDPLLREFEFDLWFSTEPGQDRLVVIGHLDHSSGFGVTTKFPLPSGQAGSMNVVQGWMSSFSTGKRGATIGLLNIRTKAPEDADRDGEPPKTRRGAKSQQIEGTAEEVQDDIERITQKQADTLVELIEAAGKTRAAFCTAWKINKVTDLPAEFYESAVNACRKLKDGARG